MFDPLVRTNQNPNLTGGVFTAPRAEDLRTLVVAEAVRIVPGASQERSELSLARALLNLHQFRTVARNASEEYSFCGVPRGDADSLFIRRLF
jgi:hypothetical protein